MDAAIAQLRKQVLQCFPPAVGNVVAFHRRRHPWALAWVLEVEGETVRVREAGSLDEFDMQKSDLKLLPEGGIRSGDAVSMLWPAGSGYSSVFYPARVLEVRSHDMVEVESAAADRSRAVVPFCGCFFVRGPPRRARAPRARKE